MNPPGHFSWHWGSGDGIAEQSRTLIFQNNAERKRFEKNWEVLKRGHERVMKSYDSEMIQLRQDIRDIGRKKPDPSLFLDHKSVYPNAEDFASGVGGDVTTEKKSRDTRANLRHRHLHSRSANSGSRVKVRDYINKTRLPSRQRDETVSMENDKGECSTKDGKVSVKFSIRNGDDAKVGVDDGTADELKITNTVDTNTGERLPLIANNVTETPPVPRIDTSVTDATNPSILPQIEESVLETTTNVTSNPDIASLPPLPKPKSKKKTDIRVSDYEYEMRLKTDPLVLTHRRLLQSPSHRNATQTPVQFSPMLRTIEYFSYKERQSGVVDQHSEDEDEQWLTNALHLHPTIPTWELKKMRSDNTLPSLFFNKTSAPQNKDREEVKHMRKMRRSSFLSVSEPSLKPLDKGLPSSASDINNFGANSGKTDLSLYIKMALRFKKKFGQARHSSQRVQSRQLRRGWGNTGVQQDYTISSGGDTPVYDDNK